MPPRIILLAFSFSSVPRRNDTDGVISLAIGVGNDEHPKRRAQAKHNKAIFDGRVLRIVEEEGALVGEDRSGFLKRDPMLASIPTFLPRVLLEPGRCHGLK